MTTKTNTKTTAATTTTKGAVSNTGRKATTTEVALTDAELTTQRDMLVTAYTEAANQEATTLATITDLTTVVGVARVYMARTAYRLATHPTILTAYAAKRITNANTKAKATGGELKPLANISGAITATGAKKTAFATAFDGGQRLAKASDVDVEATGAPTAREIELVALAWKADADRKAREAKAKPVAKAASAGVPADGEGDADGVLMEADGTPMAGSDAVLAANRFASTIGMMVKAGVTLSGDQRDAVEAVIAEDLALLAGE